MQVRFTIDPELFQAARQEETEARQRKASGKPAAAPTPDEPAAKTPRPEGRQAKHRADEQPARKAKSRPEPEGRATLFDAAPRRTRRWHRLEEFVVGPCNRVAHASALSVIEMPGEGGNPLVLHGPVGTGKTHLLEGVYAGLRRGRPEWRVVFVTAEDFTNRFVQAMRLAKLAGFRKHFRECDALLVDDLNFLATKKATQEEFLHTFDALQADGKQVVVTCDCHPRLADDFAPELGDRLLGGAVWGLAPPDADTRLDLLKAKSARSPEGLIAEEVLRHLAGQLRGNVRELEGALHSLRHYARVTGRPIDVALAREALGDLLRHAVRVVQLADVDAAVCGVLRLPAGALQSKQRAWAVSHPRMLAMFLARKHTSAAYSEIGQYFGGRNHSTAVAAEKKVRGWVQSGGELSIGERTYRVREVVELVERDLLR
ncbi:MAG TPA: chromosomal replication initiator protein DnaA, partial [Gemmataceae bacterium]|nr:chromosomal replication initiator protein DnaA [Gemmataceae bacterium]